MKEIRHWALYGSGLPTDPLNLKSLLNGSAMEPFHKLEGKTGALFSTATLTQFIKEEAIHDDYTLSENESRSIRTFSSGEQKKALLRHLLSTDPDFIVLDNIFDMLDATSRIDLISHLTDISKTISIIQIFRREAEILPFINRVVRMDRSGVLFSGPVDTYRRHFPKPEAFSLKKSIPSSPVAFEPMNNPLIQFKNISVSYNDNPILCNICWDINQGDFWQLSGPNGSGKTTLLTMITGNNPKAYGQELTLFGRKKGSGESVWDIKKKIGYVTPAMTVLFNGWHTVENMVVSGLYDSIGQYKKATPFEKGLAGQWVDLIGMTDIKQTWFSDISEEQQCLVLIARSMIKHPPLLILDEPTHGLSDNSVLVLTALINQIARETQTTIIYVSHKEEKGLKPGMTYELITGEKGSEGRVKKPV